MKDTIIAIVAIVATTLLSSGIYALTTLADNSPVEKVENIVSVTATGKTGVKISDMLCSTSSGVEVCLN